MLKKLVLFAIGAVIIIGAGAYAAFRLSPWPSVLLIRYSFDKGGAEAAASIAPLVPKDISAQRGLSYASDDRDGLFDVFTPAHAQKPLPAVVWVHGGGFVAGTRSDLSGYLQILAARGYATFAIDYSLAPSAQFPTPVRQTNAALAHIVANAKRFNVDPAHIFLAGDSAGAQIAAQTGLVISDANYAREMKIDSGMTRASLRGVVLFCGPYDPASLNFEGPFADFMRTVIWSYVGTRNPHDARVRQISIAPHVTAIYPPAFISVGNADPLAPRSVAFAEALRTKGVEVDILFFPTITIRRWITNINCCSRLTQAASRLTVQSFSWQPTQSDGICACADPAELLLPRLKMRAGARRSELLPDWRSRRSA